MYERGVEVLAGVPAGPELAAALAHVDRPALNGFELVEVAKAVCRQVAHYQAELLATVAEVAYCPPGDETSPAERSEYPAEYAADEVRLALTLTRRAADTLVGDAYTLVERLPAVYEVLRSGRVDLARARVLDQETAVLPESVAREMVDLILPVAGGLTTGQLRVRLRRLVIEADPSAAAVRGWCGPGTGPAGHPGCRTPAHRADLDHTIAWQDGGPTTAANLGVLCRHCHGYKHSAGVTLTQPTPGTFTWTTRLGHTYTTRAEPP
ncbi:HNH endonuclease signature motif containing protein [Phytohabitans suffuscus]|uniref:HNH nuclease domain-containing protein n=1 Tax=Phytohabitans suffuscus TaxID=624315 RepID=A0A6F8YS74_9ACTN|nr:HNH endonuclease signature motif containing protein [Phytohabitans suffuscus]BCB88952.1 hypothetical protein Psuf_062650 [Phytohabitans suffuscus]